jgi:hypothetical protein
MGEGEDEGERLRFYMPWHVATLIKEWAQCNVPLQLFNICRGLIYHARGFSV